MANDPDAVGRVGFKWMTIYNVYWRRHHAGHWRRLHDRLRGHRVREVFDHDLAECVGEGDEHPFTELERPWVAASRDPLEVALAHDAGGVAVLRRVGAGHRRELAELAE